MMKRYMILLSALLLNACSSMNPLDLLADEESAVQPAELVEVSNQVAVTTLWSTTVGGGAGEQQIKLSPLVMGGQLYVAGHNGVIKALNAASGRAVWSIDSGLEISGGIGGGENLLLVGTANAEVIAFDTANGSERWRTRVSSEVLSTPQVGHGKVVVHTIDGKVVGLNAADGSQAWIYDRTIPVLTLYGSSSPVISGDNVICGFSSGKLAALDLASGNLQWEISVTAPSGRSELERMVDIDGDPLVRDGVIYVTTYQGEMAAISESNGSVLWRRKLSSYTSLGADADYLYVSDAEGHVWAIAPRNGSALWRNKKMQARGLSAPAVVSDYVVVGDFEGYLHWLTRSNGRIVARTRVGKAPINTPPVVVDNVAYVYGNGGVLSALAVR
ncbi:MAG: outer membrane protein assembly factor BamB [Sedimenticola sp.]